MAGWILYLIFPLFCLPPGLLVLFLFKPQQSTSTQATSLGEFLFRAVLAGFLLHSAVLFVLVEVGLLFLGPFLALEGLLLLLLLAGVWRRRRVYGWPKPTLADLIPLTLLVLAALLLGQPHPAIFGGSDPGAYVGIAATIARTGGLRASDPVLAAMDAGLARRELLFANMPGLSMPYHRLPGYYAIDPSRGTLLPQFYHLYPLWLALGFDVIGFPAGLFVTPVLAAWAIVAIFQAGRAIFGKRPASLAGLLFTLSPLFLWLGRHPISEVLALFLLFCVLYGFVTFLRSGGEDRTAGILSGAALGGLLHTRADSVLAVALIGLWLAFRLLADGRRWSGLTPFLLPLGISLAHWGLYVALFTWGYTLDALGGGLRFLLGPGAWPAGLLVAGIFLLVVLLARRRSSTSWWSVFRVSAVTGVLLLVGFAWFVWPQLHPPADVGFFVWNGWEMYQVTQSQNFVQLTWYLTPLGVVLGVGGLCLALLWEEGQRIAYMVGLALLYGFLYTYHSADFPAQPYVMRRYFVVLIPVLILAAMYLLYRLAQTRGWAARVVAGALLFFLGWTFLVFSQLPRQVNDFSGLDEQIAALSRQFAPQDILLFTDVVEGTALAFPLQYIYQRNSFVLQRPEPDSWALRKQVEDWRSEGRGVYVVVAQGESRLSPEVFSLEWQASFTVHWEQLESPLNRPPDKVVEAEILYNIYALAESWEETRLPVVDVGGADYPYLLEGFWAPERTPQGVTFRWTKGDAAVELPGEWFDSSGPLTLTLALGQGWASPDGLPFLEVWLGGQLLRRFTPAAELQDYVIPLPEGFRTEVAGQRAVVLRLRGSTWVPASAGSPDTRELGVVLDAISVQTAP